MAAVTRMKQGFAGQVAENATLLNKRTAVSEETSAEIRFGIMVAQGSENDGALLLATNGDVLKGVVLHNHDFAKDNELGDDGLKPNVAFDVLTRGTVRVLAEAAMTVGDEVHVRATANGPNTTLGIFRATKDGAHTIDISAFARVVEDGDATTPPVIELDMLFAAAAVIS